MAGLCCVFLFQLINSGDNNCLISLNFIIESVKRGLHLCHFFNKLVPLLCKQVSANLCGLSASALDCASAPERSADMAVFPKQETDILSLANAMIAGYTENPSLFPHADLAALETATDDR